jgi:hypothetical protein
MASRSSPQVSYWHDQNDPSVMVIPLDTDDDRSDAGVRRWREYQRRGYERYVAGEG